ncbi:helicase [Anticarsia gemmatalis multiple nucleopolyhedrovirus]|uniref:Helicase n=1 Tax=Anticarsia gemmatalis multiple nucleopolyhedrovirus TaxID=268591 RepID=A0A0S3IZX7_9ABAC|nr:helicase [Anticarsia gemmatalis multiple nucleopolyhedrovirus]ALR71604.1 helicase [Anticarsia gemmatalis multiple nucleopolyhedrovirus]
MESILPRLLKDVTNNEEYAANSLRDATQLIIKDTRTGSRKLFEHVNSFREFLNTIKSGGNGPCAVHQRAPRHDNEDVDDEAAEKQSVSYINHSLVLENNDFCVFVKPFLLKKHYNVIKNYLKLDSFLSSENPEHTNKCVEAGDYCYWPNWPASQAVSFTGWQLFLFLKFHISVESTIPIIHNKHLGPVDLFVFNPETFLNIEMSLCTNETPPVKLFVNGKSVFDDKSENVFEIKMANNATATCKLAANLVNCHKNLFHVIRDNINLEECITTPKYKHIINVNLTKLREFSNETPSLAVTTGERGFQAPAVTAIISASSENAETIQNEIDKALIKVREGMVKVLASNNRADDADLLQKYFEDSNFKNFHFLLFVIWKQIIKRDRKSFRETDVKLFFELVCETLFGDDKDVLTAALARCEPFVTRSVSIFNNLCDHWHCFRGVNPYYLLGSYYGAHYFIYFKLSSNESYECDDPWAFTHKTAMDCEVPLDVLGQAFFIKVENVVTQVTLIFNGEHYQIVKKDDELYKMIKTNSHKLQNVKFNNWKYMYHTQYGVYNVITDEFYSNCPFLLGTTMPGTFKRPDDPPYLSETVFMHMLNTSAEERDILRTYHVAKLCRDVKMVKVNFGTVNLLGNCAPCQLQTRVQLNELFRELWNFDDENLLTLALYVNKIKIEDIVHNFKCNPCRAGAKANTCKCVRKIKINRMALKVCLIFDLFVSDPELSQLMWMLILSSNKLYVTTALILTGSDLVNEHANFFVREHAKIAAILHRELHKIEFVDTLMADLCDRDAFLANLQQAVANEATPAPNDDVIVNKFYLHYANATNILHKYKNLWWDKTILARDSDTLTTWLTRFYMRVIMSKVDLKNYSINYLTSVVEGYLYFKRYTNFNHASSFMLMHFAGGLVVPTNYGRKAVYLPGEPMSGKSTFFELLESLVLMHKFDDETHTGDSKETSDKEVSKLNSQLYTINELKKCSESFFKKNADSINSDSKSRKYQGLLKYEANYKMLIVNNNPLYVDDYDDAVQDRFLIVYTDHKFVSDLPFSGSIYHHILTKQYPQESMVVDTLKDSLRLFLAHLVKYRRDPQTGLVPYKTLLNNDPVHQYNLTRLSVNNSPMYALIYMLNIKTAARAANAWVTEEKMQEMIGYATQHLKSFLHPSFTQYNASKNINAGTNKSFVFDEQILLQQIKDKFKNNYDARSNKFINLTMALNKLDMNTNAPRFRSQ